jgi:hypothetical protein
MEKHRWLSQLDAQFLGLLPAAAAGGCAKCNEAERIESAEICEICG